MFNEYDIVKAKENLSEKVYKGCKGAILIVFEGIPMEYEVEFVDNEGDSLEVMTVKEYDIEKL